MKKRKCYTILSKNKRHNYGIFERTKDGLAKAKKYKLNLIKDLKMEFIIK